MIILLRKENLNDYALAYAKATKVVCTFGTFDIDGLYGLIVHILLQSPVRVGSQEAENATSHRNPACAETESPQKLTVVLIHNQPCPCQAKSRNYRSSKDLRAPAGGGKRGENGSGAFFHHEGAKEHEVSITIDHFLFVRQSLP